MESLVNPPKCFDLDRLLSSNDMPLPDETVAIQNILAAERERVDQMRAEIQAFDGGALADAQRLNYVRALQDEVDRSFTRYRAILAILRRVPAEIIFKRTLTPTTTAIFPTASSNPRFQHNPAGITGTLTRRPKQIFITQLLFGDSNIAAAGLAAALALLSTSFAP
ncbi:hypothetical protein B0H16DRAFT_1736757 [Mycena metata]|uniref:Uncharacterized protein n=1 Tax=Mycena metata TaxID=1033252 RepID=A0AAD7HNM9_9AGAR|nr:hypothetical protein B0H16DRAFT_1736757 [Mycena metata]